MIMVRLTYASRATEKFNTTDIGSIIESSTRNNPKLDVTGLLFIDKQYFFQCLEGPRDSVNQVYRKLINDERHQNVQLIGYQEAGNRYFGGWSMKYVPSKVVTSKVLKETGLVHFDPYQLKSQSCEHLLQAFCHYKDAGDTVEQEVKITPRALISLN